MNDILSIDEILQRAQQEGILWDVSGHPFRKYKFVVDERHAFDIVRRTIEKIYQLQGYSFLEWHVEDGEKIHHTKIGYRPPQTEKVVQMEPFDPVIAGDNAAFQRRGSSHFASLYFVEPTAKDAQRNGKEGPEAPMPGKRVIIINCLDIEDYRVPLLETMNAFYSTHQSKAGRSASTSPTIPNSISA